MTSAPSLSTKYHPRPPPASLLHATPSYGQACSGKCSSDGLGNSVQLQTTGCEAILHDAVNAAGPWPDQKMMGFLQGRCHGSDVCTSSRTRCWSSGWAVFRVQVDNSCACWLSTAYRECTRMCGYGPVWFANVRHITLSWHE